MTPMRKWQFAIDVGGTFTDCVARDPNGGIYIHKTLSSGKVKGRIDQQIDASTIIDVSRIGDPADFWVGARVRLSELDQPEQWSATIAEFESDTGKLIFDAPLPTTASVLQSYEIDAGEEAPVLCIRYLLELPLGQKIPPVDLRLGTTRGTNALLERKGARTAFVTTKGFSDVLKIGNQDRPRLFDLDIRKPVPLNETVIEADERLKADGAILKTLELDSLRSELQSAYSNGIDSVAICLLHAYLNPVHEIQIESICREIGFEEVSRSSDIAPMIKMVPRADTTNVDAYLTPILRKYVDVMRASLPGSEIQLMTSSGGLVAADRFSGKDSILSGPAGGVIGYAKVAEQAGFPKTIGFDMGGTSTDVSRFDGVFNREYETEKAGVRLVAPMMAIETVAAGGGSICRFDGIKLIVGPESAGSSPGPCSYGSDGPLTVTDMNLFLGRLPADRFPFALDVEAVEKKLNSLIETIFELGGPKYVPEELAQGFLDVANANMVRAIRRISVAEGYDPREYGLVSFGGAGAQHACSIARELGIPSVLLHPYGGVLSAYGIGVAETRVIRECTVMQGLETCREDIPQLFDNLSAEAEPELHKQVLHHENMTFQTMRSMELRYRGVESTIEIRIEENTDIEADIEYEFLDEHRRRFGYAYEDREIEVYAIRVEYIAKRNEKQTHHSVKNRNSTSHPPIDKKKTTEVWFQKRLFKTPLVDRMDLVPGESISGPLIVLEDTSTIVVEPGFTATLQNTGELILHVDAEELPAKEERMENDQADPVLLEIFNNLFASIAEQMGESLRRTSCSTNVKERLDFSCAVFTAIGDLVANAPHIPVHLGAMGETVKQVLRDNPDLKPGDVIVTNDPYRGGSHLPDVTVISPVFDESFGTLQFFVASRAHHAEIGGIVPGSMPAFSKSLADEGVLIRNFRLISDGQSFENELRDLLLSGPYPTRRVEDNLADISAQVAANQTGAGLLRELVGRYSASTVINYMDFIRDAASRKMRQALVQFPDGEYAMTDHLDDGSPIAVRIMIKGDAVVVDFSGTGPVVTTNLNANRSIVMAAVLYVFRCMINEDIPLNSGVLEPVELILPECLLNPPIHDDPRDCAAIVGGNVETSQRVVDVLLGALGLAAASQGTMNNLTFGDNTFGYYETICGGSGATSNSPGVDAVHTHMTNTRLTDVEIIEHRYPVRIQSFQIRKDSGGTGEYAGGDGIIREIEFLKPLHVSMLSQRRGEYLQFGRNGGKSGAAGINRIRRADGTEQNLGGCFQIEVAAGDVLVIETPGGGGYGES